MQGQDHTISIGCECGGPEAVIFATRKVALHKALERHVTSTQCAAIDEFALVLRVDGRLTQYGPEGTSRLRFAKARRYITVDLQIPESRWKPLLPDELDAYLVTQVRAGLEACCTRLERDGYEVHRTALMAQVAQGFNEFISKDASEPSSSAA